jgi:hypothetical protein
MSSNRKAKQRYRAAAQKRKCPRTRTHIALETTVEVQRRKSRSAKRSEEELKGRKIFGKSVVSFGCQLAMCVWTKHKPPPAFAS